MVGMVGCCGEPAGGFGRDQIFHHRLVDEGESAVGVPAQRRTRTEQVSGLVRGQAPRIAHRPEHLAGDLGQPGQVDEGDTVAPQGHGQLGDGGVPFVDRQLR